MDERSPPAGPGCGAWHAGRPALLLAFAPPGAAGRARSPPGTPCAGSRSTPARSRAGVCGRPGEPGPGCPAGGARSAPRWHRYAAALAADPWLDRWPLLLDGVTPAVDDGWALVDLAATRCRCGALDPWPLLAVSAGEPLTVAGEWSAAGLLPLSCWDGDRPVRL